MNTPTPPIPDDDHPISDPPLPMSASVILTSLPRDAHAALQRAEQSPTLPPSGAGVAGSVGGKQKRLEGVDEQGSAAPKKVNIRFKPIASAPPLRTSVYKISSTQRFETIVKFLRGRLKCKDTDSVFLYVNSVFAPGLDEGIENLFNCFKTDDQLIVAYSMTPAFG